MSKEVTLEEQQGKATWHKNPFVIAAGILLIIGLGLIEPAREYLHEQKLENMIAQLAGASAQTMDASLTEMRLLEKTDQVLISNDETAKSALQDYFGGKIAALIDPQDDNYDFAAARAVIAEIREFYPDSVFLQEQSDLLSRAEAEIISALAKRICLDPQGFSPDQCQQHPRKNRAHRPRTPIDQRPAPRQCLPSVGVAGT